MTKELRNAQFVTDLTNVRAIMEQQLGADNINMIYVLRPLAAQLVAQGNYEDAEPVQIAIMRLCQRSTSPVLPSRQEAMTAMAEILLRLGKFNLAKPMYNELFNAEVLNSGAGSAASLSLLGSLVHCLYELDRVDEATEKVRSTVNVLSATGSTSQRLHWLNCLSRLLCEQKKYSEAAAISESTLTLYDAEVAMIPQLEMTATLYQQAGNTADYERIRARRRELAAKYDY